MLTRTERLLVCFGGRVGHPATIGGVTAVMSGAPITPAVVASTPGLPACWSHRTRPADRRPILPALHNRQTEHTRPHPAQCTGCPGRDASLTVENLEKLS